jgi:GntR family transcriptional regulator
MSEDLNSSSALPLYVQVVGRIQYAIDSGEYGIGDKIPSEGELQSLFSVGRITIRRAIEELVAAGYLMKKQGKGTFVKAPGNLHLVQSRLDSQVFSYTEACEKASLAAGSVELGSSLVEPTADDRAFLGIEGDDKVLVTRRVRTADGVPIMIEENHFSLSDFPFLAEANLENRSLYGLIEKRTGRRPKMVGECVLSSARAVENVAAQLSVPVGEPLFSLHARYADGDDRPLYIGDQLIVGARWSFTF